MRCSSFLNLVFRKRRFVTENWLCFRACNSRIITYDQEFCYVVWFSCFQSLLRNPFLWKVFFEGTLPWFLEMFWVANHGVVENMCSFSKSYLLKGSNKFWSNYLFPCDFWVKDFSPPLWKKVWKLFHFGRWLSFVLES